MFFSDRGLVSPLVVQPSPLWHNEVMVQPPTCGVNKDAVPTSSGNGGMDAQHATLATMYHYRSVARRGGQQRVSKVIYMVHVIGFARTKTLNLRNIISVSLCSTLPNIVVLHVYSIVFCNYYKHFFTSLLHVYFEFHFECHNTESLQVGDVLLEISGNPTEGMLHSDAITIVKHGGDWVRLIVKRVNKQDESVVQGEGTGK